MPTTKKITTKSKGGSGAPRTIKPEEASRSRAKKKVGRGVPAEPKESGRTHAGNEPKKTVAASTSCERTSKRAPETKTVTTESACFIKRTVTEDGVCILTFDAPGSSANVLREEVLVELGEHLSWIEKQNHHEVRALVIDSAKSGIFIAGADIEALYRLSPEELERLLVLGQGVFNRLSDISIPTVAAIHGACMGGGLELALSCDYRVASDDKATKLALPETMLGIVPAWGGCARLPRLIGAPKALGLILSGKKLAARQAKKLGVVDAVSPREYLMNTARTLLQGGKAHRNPHPLTNNRLSGALLRAYLGRQLRTKTRGNYPAPMKALEVVTLGAWRSRTDALKLERDAVSELAASPETKNLIRAFLLQQRAKKTTFATPTTKVGRAVPGEPSTASPAKKEVGPAVPGEPSTASPPKKEVGPAVPGEPRSSAPIKRVAVIGAGVMGAGIAHWLSSRNLKVTLQDINAEKIASGLSLIASRYAEAVSRRIFTKAEARRLQENVSPAADPVPLHGADLVIEAATENLELKKKIFQDLAARIGPNTILATNTSALPISELAKAVAEVPRPKGGSGSSVTLAERVIGIHFFNPVHRMQLVEIVVPKTTAPEVVQATLAFVKGIGKLPVIVSDSPGFLVNRVLLPYLVEAGNLFANGVSAETIDKAMLDFGMPMGPIRLLDEIGLDVALDVAQTLAVAFPDRMSVPPILEEMITAGRLGKKSGQGFYPYRKGGAEVGRLQTASALHADSPFTRDDLQSRMALVMVNEAARCLDESVVAEPEDVDFAMIMGTGFAPFRGGPLRYADSLGIVKIIATLNRFANHAGGNHFLPCPRLIEMAKNNQTFYATA